MYKLDKKRAVITGAASGLGRSLAAELAGDGWKVGIVDINDDGSEATLEMVMRAGGTGEVLHADVSEHADVKGMADHFFNTWGGVDLLINCAGVAAGGYVGDIPLDDWRWVHAITFWGMLHGCHEFIPRMKTQGGGHIVNVASVAGLFTFPTMSPYGTAKAAVVSLSEALRIELAPDDIGVTVACPMFFKTNISQATRVEDDEAKESMTICLDHSRISSDEVARRIIKEVKKNKLYAFPMASGRVFWTAMRLSPGFFYEAFRLTHRRGLLTPIVRKLARMGLM